MGDKALAPTWACLLLAQSRHALVHCKCLLLTQSGHACRLLTNDRGCANLSRFAVHAKRYGLLIDARFSHLVE
jgi:hypothetical protein